MPTAVGARVIVLMALLLGAALSWWLLRGLSNPSVKHAVKARHIADYSLQKFTVNAMNDRGKLYYRLHADHMSHYLDDDTSRVDRPNMTVFKEGNALWNVYAKRGWISAGQKSIVLRGDVLIWRNAVNDGPGLEIQTDELHITPDKQYAETARPVTISQEIGVTRAVGMRVDLEKSTMELLAAVQGHYTLKR